MVDVPDAERALRVMTWNVRGGARPDAARIARVVREQDPDVLALQEVREGQARRLAAVLGGAELRWNAKHRPPFLPGPFGRRWTEGLAVLSRLPLLAADAVTVSTGAPVHSYRRRIAQDLEFAVGDVAVRLINTHLASDDAPSRGDQTGRVLGLLAERDRVGVDHTLVVGDLNTPNEEAVIGALVAAGLGEIWPRVGVGEGLTNPAHAPTQRLDHVLAGAGLEPTAARVITSADVLGCSDHLPLVVDVRVVDPHVVDARVVD